MYEKIMPVNMTASKDGSLQRNSYINNTSDQKYELFGNTLSTFSQQKQLSFHQNKKAMSC
jgi:hypothetical protein